MNIPPPASLTGDRLQRAVDDWKRATRVLLAELGEAAIAVLDGMATLERRVADEFARFASPSPSLIEEIREFGEALVQARVEVLVEQRDLERARRLERPRALRPRLVVRPRLRLTMRRAPRRGPHRSRALLGRAHPMNRSSC